MIAELPLRVSRAAAILSNAAFVRRVSATCCSYNSIIVIPDAVRGRLKRVITIHAPMSIMNGHYENKAESKSCVVIQDVSTFLRVIDKMPSKR